MYPTDLANLAFLISISVKLFAPLPLRGVIQWTGPVGQMDASGDPYLTQFITGSAKGPIEAVR